MAQPSLELTRYGDFLHHSRAALTTRPRRLSGKDCLSQSSIHEPSLLKGSPGSFLLERCPPKALRQGSQEQTAYSLQNYLDQRFWCTHYANRVPKTAPPPMLLRGRLHTPLLQITHLPVWKHPGDRKHVAFAYEMTWFITNMYNLYMA